MENGYPTRAEINHMWMKNDEEDMCKMYDYMVAMHNEMDRMRALHTASEKAWRDQDGSQCIRINCIYRRIICEENAERREAQRGRDDL